MKALENKTHLPQLRWRLVLSLLFLWHMAAVFVAPFTFATAGPGGASPLATFGMRCLGWYVDAAYLNHGYFFFAPNPGPSHLIRARIEFANGQAPIIETFPDLKAQWPRLLYHRHFMLSEQLNGQFAPPEPPNNLRNDSAQLERWREARAMYDLKWKSFENHLRAKYPDAASITLTRVEHRMIDVGEVIDQRKPLTAPDTFLELPEVATPGATR